jgi:hypothetical protein
MKYTILALLFTSWLAGQTTAPALTNWDALKFLEGTWLAQTPGSASGPAVSGTYDFKKELGGHILARHSSSDGCKGPSDFDCDHHDLLYVFQDAPGQPLKAIYFDNEGHVIHYDVSVPEPETVVFLSNGPGPKFRLTYQLKNSRMSGKFQMQVPGQMEWKSYLEWSGLKK